MYNGKEQEMRERWIICATILILCYSSPSAINTTYGENPLNLVHPVGVQYPISQPFGPSSDQNLQKLYKSWQYDGHFGIDYAVPVGTAVFACDDGEVFEVNNSNPEHPNGLFLRIRHKWGSSVYCHLSRVFVHNGERVSKELNNLNIGSSGKTGFVTGPHLHFGMRISSIPNTGYKDYIDPQKYARFATPPVTQPSTSKMTRQKKPPEINKVQKLLSTKKIQQDQIVTKLQKPPGKATIKAGHPEEAKKIFAIIRKKEAQRLSTQEVQKLASADRELPEAAKLPEYSQKTILLRKRIKTYNKKLQNIGGVLLRNIPNPPSIEFKLTASEEVNAWADGRITMELMEFLYSNPTGNPDNQLAMVMAHIIIHEKLETESVNKMLAVGLGKSKATHNDIIDGLSHAFSVVLAPITTPLFSFLVAETSGTAAKGIVNWITKKTLKTFQGYQEDTSHLFSILYLKKAGFDASEGLKIFNSSVAFSRQHPINRQIWENYAKEVQAKLDHERQLAVRSRTDQKKPPEINKVQKLPSTKKIQQNQIVTKPQKSPGKTTIKAGHPEEAKKIFTIIRKKEAQRLSTQEVQKLASTDRKLVSKLERTPGKVIIGDGLIKQKGSFNVYLLLDGKKYLIPDRATLKSLNFEKQGVRVLTSSDFNSIPRGNFKELFALKKDGRQLGTQTEGVRKALETFEQRQADYHIEEYEKSINSELRNLKNQKAGNKVQRLPSTRKFNIPRIYKKTAKNPEKPLAKSNFVIPDGYKRTKSYYSRNIPSSSYKDSLGRELYLDSLKEMEKQYIEALKTTPNRNEGQSYIDQLGSFSPEERKQFEKNLKFLQAEIRNPSY